MLTIYGLMGGDECGEPGAVCVVSVISSLQIYLYISCTADITMASVCEVGEEEGGSFCLSITGFNDYVTQRHVNWVLCK